MWHVQSRKSRRCRVATCTAKSQGRRAATLAQPSPPTITSPRLILACDTIAEIDGQVLGKPDNIEQARRMLSLLRGRVHRVLSGICLWQVPDRAPDLRVAVTELRMDELTEQQLEEYLATYAWEAKPARSVSRWLVLAAHHPR